MFAQAADGCPVGLWIEARNRGAQRPCCSSRPRKAGTGSGPAASALASVSIDAIDHLDLVVTDMQRSLAFYRELLRPLGYVRESPIEGERGEHVVYLGRVGGMGSVSIRAAQSDAHAVPYDRYAVGVHHIAFRALSRGVVDERAAWLREQGATIESGPQEYDYSPGYYAVFFYDPDQIKLELVHRPSERDLAARLAQLTERLARLEAAAGGD
ncbi:MAG: glyoxylase family protein [Solirubrobacteraceae bacterium]|nr:glyoxylase family protein [Solirubrobacteraceae bacterium]